MSPRPQTSFRITATGRRRYVDYLAVLEQVITDASGALDAQTNAKGSSEPVNA